MAARLEFVRWPKDQDNAGEGSFQFFDRYPARTGGRVVQADLSFTDPFEDQKVIEIPKQNSGRFELQKCVDLAPDSAAIQAHPARCLQKIARLTSVPCYPAIDPQLFERHPKSVITQQNAEGGSAALDRLHLKERRSDDPFWLCVLSPNWHLFCCAQNGQPARRGYWIPRVSLIFGMTYSTGLFLSTTIDAVQSVPLNIPIGGP